MADVHQQTTTQDDDIEMAPKTIDLRSATDQLPNTNHSSTQLHPTNGDDEHPHKKRNKFDIYCKTFFLTYSRINDKLTKENCKEVLTKMLPNIQWIIIGEEKHEKEGRHLHTVFEIKSKKRIRDERFFDIFGNHPKIESARDKNKAIKYVTKDGNYIEHGISAKDYMKSREQHTSTKSTIIAKKIEQGATLTDINKEHADFLLLHAKQVQYYFSILETIKQINNKPKPFKAEPKNNNPCTIEICKWINANFFKERTHKQPQLWLWGDANNGKTWTVLKLQQHGIRTYPVKKDDKWYFDHYNDEAFDLIYFEEYTGKQQPATNINQLVEGVQMLLPTKGGDVKKHKNLPVIFCCQNNIKNCYSGIPQNLLEAVQARFTEILCTNENHNTHTVEFDLI